jgi:hypothetical protein
MAERKFSSGERMWNPGMSRPVCTAGIPGYYNSLLSSIPDLRMWQLAWAGDQQVLYVEWQASGHFVGKPFQLNVVDCFEFIKGYVIYGTAYFDTVTLLGLLNPAINSIHFAPPTNAAAQ